MTRPQPGPPRTLSPPSSPSTSRSVSSTGYESDRSDHTSPAHPNEAEDSAFGDSLGDLDGITCYPATYLRRRRRVDEVFFDRFGTEVVLVNRALPVLPPDSGEDSLGEEDELETVANDPDETLVDEEENHQYSENAD